ncbi:hypothetical protein ACFPZN_34270 [Actinomadura rugatobispora]|uniref:Uncharacterized protein n=2 Tax=Actinomadura rugatobispora TaxID=1994 RepID=A0ABW1AAR5_9ACTN
MGVDDILDDSLGWGIETLVLMALQLFQTVLEWSVSEVTAPRMSGENGGVLFFVRYYAANWLVAFMVPIGLAIASINVFITRKGAPFRKAFFNFSELALNVLLLGVVVFLVTRATQSYSAWILDLGQRGRSGGRDWMDGWDAGLDGLGGGDADIAYSALLGIFALAAVPALAVQFCVMLFYAGFLPFLVALQPALAAARFSEFGEQAYRRSKNAIIVIILAKPYLITLDAAAVYQLTSDYEPDHLFGLALLIGGVFYAPRLISFVLPDSGGFGAPTIRTLGHMVFGGTAVNIGKGASIFNPNGVQPVRNGNVPVPASYEKPPRPWLRPTGGSGSVGDPPGQQPPGQQPPGPQPPGHPVQPPGPQPPGQPVHPTAGGAAPRNSPPGQPLGQPTTAQHSPGTQPTGAQPPPAGPPGSTDTPTPPTAPTTPPAPPTPEGSSVRRNPYSDVPLGARPRYDVGEYQVPPPDFSILDDDNDGPDGSKTV